MDYILSIGIGLIIGIILWVAPILAGLLGSTITYPLYLAVSIYAPLMDTDLPKWPYIIISIFFAFQFFKINDNYDRVALSNAPQWAARCQATYMFLTPLVCIINFFT